jgi:hypothetical protein
MGRTARERLARLLDDAEAPGAFSAQILAPAGTLRVEVDGVGAVQTPVRAPLAKKLLAVAQPAKFGRGEQTLTDTSVRDTSEITPDLVTLDGPTWEATLGAVLDGVRDELGLPPTTKLRAELHAMLVYGKGQRLPSRLPVSGAAPAPAVDTPTGAHGQPPPCPHPIPTIMIRCQARQTGTLPTSHGDEIPGITGR